MADNPEKKETAARGQAAWWQPAIMMSAKLSAWVAGPIIIALYLGKWLDKKYDSAPKLLLLCVGLAFITSMVGLIKNTITEAKKISQLSRSNKPSRDKK